MSVIEQSAKSHSQATKDALGGVETVVIVTKCISTYKIEFSNSLGP